MAIYHQDIADIELNSGSLHRSFLNHSIGLGDAAANRFGVRVFRDGAAETLSGVTCQAFFRNANGENIALTSYGTIDGNVAYVTLPQACYNIEGMFTLAIKLVGGGVTGTMRIIDGMVDNTNTGSAVAPTGSVPTYQEVLSVYEQMQAALSNYDAKVTEQDGKIDSLKSAVNDISKVGKATYSTLGYHNLNYNLVNRKQYNVNVSSTTATAAVIVKTPDDQTIDTVYQGQRKTITATADVAYLRLYFNANDEITFTIEELDTQIDRLRTEMIEAVDSVHDELFNLPYIQEYNVNNVSNGYINTSGGIVNSNGWFITDYMPIKNGDLAYYDGLVTIGASPSSAYYDSNKNLISGSVFKQAAGKNQDHSVGGPWRDRQEPDGDRI